MLHKFMTQSVNSWSAGFNSWCVSINSCFGFNKTIHVFYELPLTWIACFSWIAYGMNCTPCMNWLRHELRAQPSWIAPLVHWTCIKRTRADWYKCSLRNRKLKELCRNASGERSCSNLLRESNLALKKTCISRSFWSVQLIKLYLTQALRST